MIRVCCLMLFLVTIAGAEPAGSTGGPSVGDVQASLRQAVAYIRSISTEGGYVYQYSLDLKTRSAERPATETQIAIEPPGTPSMGIAFLRAYSATQDPFYLEAAREAALALSRCQLGSGGWHPTADFDPARPNEDGRLYGGDNYKFGQVIKHTLSTKFDDNTTQSAVTFLLAYSVAVRDSADPRDDVIRETLDRALRDGMLGAQYPNGAWPQCYHAKPRNPDDYPIKKAHIPDDYLRTWPDEDYTPYYTFNDLAQSDCVKVMFLAWKVLGNPVYLDSAVRGSDFILLAQLPEPQPAWAQQYDFDMVPAWARSHECPAVSSHESAGPLRTLLVAYLATGERKYFDAASAAVGWLERSAVGPNRWMRLYELKTNRPVFGDDRGEILYSRDELRGKFKTSYNWESSYKIPEVLNQYEQVKNAGHERISRIAEEAGKKELSLHEVLGLLDVFGRWKGLSLCGEMALEDPEPEQENVLTIINSLDGKGRWISKDRWRKGAPLEEMITTKTFIGNVRILTEYLSRN